MALAPPASHEELVPPVAGGDPEGGEAQAGVPRELHPGQAEAPAGHGVADVERLLDAGGVLAEAGQAEQAPGRGHGLEPGVREEGEPHGDHPHQGRESDPPRGAVPVEQHAERGLALQPPPFVQELGACEQAEPELAHGPEAEELPERELQENPLHDLRREQAPCGGLHLLPFLLHPVAIFGFGHFHKQPDAHHGPCPCPRREEQVSGIRVSGIGASRLQQPPCPAALPGPAVVRLDCSARSGSDNSESEQNPVSHASILTGRYHDCPTGPAVRLHARLVRSRSREIRALASHTSALALLRVRHALASRSCFTQRISVPRPNELLLQVEVFLFCAPGRREWSSFSGMKALHRGFVLMDAEEGLEFGVGRPCQTAESQRADAKEACVCFLRYKVASGLAQHLAQK